MTTPTIAHTPAAAALFGLADTLSGLSQARVSPPDMFRALRVTIRDTESRYQAYGVFTSYVRGTPGYDGWLDNWVGPRERAEVVRLVREAAAASSGETR